MLHVRLSQLTVDPAEQDGVRDGRARDSCPDIGAIIRSNVIDRDGCQVDPPEDYRLAASTVSIP